MRKPAELNDFATPNKHDTGLRIRQIGDIVDYYAVHGSATALAEKFRAHHRKRVLWRGVLALLLVAVTGGLCMATTVHISSPSGPLFFVLTLVSCVTATFASLTPSLRILDFDKIAISKDLYRVLTTVDRAHLFSIRDETASVQAATQSLMLGRFAQAAAEEALPHNRDAAEREHRSAARAEELLSAQPFDAAGDVDTA